MTTTFTPPRPLNTAVLFLVFNRPDTTERVFEAIRQAKPPRLYVAADGPRADREGEAEKVAKVRKIATAVDWPCEICTLFREKNLSCGPAVKKAIDWFFEHEHQGVILEDDTIPVIDFFYFCEELLVKYRDDQRVAMIAGTNHTAYKPIQSSYLFSKNKACWGWATWKRSWQNMDFMMSWRNLEQADSVKKNMGFTGLHLNHWENAINAIDQKRVSAWDWQWYFSIAAQNQLTIFPSVNLVSNVGFGDDATHTKGGEQTEFVSTSRLSFPILHPERICPDIRFDVIFESKNMRPACRVRKYIPRFIKEFLKGLLRWCKS